MKVFIWHQIEHATDSYHPEGGVVVFASDEARAREVAAKNPTCKIAADEKPDEVRDCSGDEERLFIMPNAGCC